MSFSIRLLLPALATVAACTKDAPPPPARVPVTISTAERRAVPYELLATGTVEPIQTVAVQAQVSGPIVRIAFREGQDVKRGQILFELDPRPFRAALQQAQALLGRDRATAENAESEAKRYAALAEKEYVTAQQNDAARTTAAASSATMASSQAAVDQARLNLQYATIRAPIDGRTGSLRVREGNLVRSSDTQPLVTINQIRPILVRFAVPASNLGAIQKYRAQRIGVTAEPVGGGTPSEGTLTFVDNTVDTATGTVLLKGNFPNTDGALWPGAFVNVRIRLYVDENALVVPAAAVVSGQQGSFVFVIQPDSSAATKSVKVDRTAGDLAIVSGEVRAGDRVVVDGQLRLRQGIKVQIKASGDSARARAS
jgi:membrane fusion protein, multidrug efflux system